MACKHKSEKPIGTYCIGGDCAKMFRCDVHRICIPEPINGIAHHACKGCPDYVDGQPDYLLCSHRGVDLKEPLSCSCGSDKTVFACELHGKCCKRLPLGKTVDQFPGITFCSYCKDVINE